ncbi:uncharacterized protein LOC142333458 isoform X9 [Lycorma delicatula]|uniref:uncharacterized protein LOC142333458 isoform X9 n=1 Tax=Lycorma delicatula TaxID=130591 RepID=UPI003F5171F8
MRIIIYVMSFFIFSVENAYNENRLFISEKYSQHKKYPNLQARCKSLENDEFAKKEFKQSYIKYMYDDVQVSCLSGLFRENKLDKLKEHIYYSNSVVRLTIFEERLGEKEAKLLPTLLQLLDVIPDKIIIKGGIIYTEADSIVSGIDITETISSDTNSNEKTYTNISTRLPCDPKFPETSNYADLEYVMPPEPNGYADLEYVMPPEPNGYADLEYVMPPEPNGYADLEYVMPPDPNGYADLEYVMPPEPNGYADLEYVMPPEPNGYADLEYVIMDNTVIYAYYKCGSSLEKQKFQLRDEETEKKIIKKVEIQCTLRLNTETVMNNFVEDLTPVLSVNEEKSLLQYLFTSYIQFELRFSYICKFVSPLQTFVNKNILQYKILNFTVGGYQLTKFLFLTKCIGLTYCLQHQHIDNYVSSLNDHFLYEFDVQK